MINLLILLAIVAIIVILLPLTIDFIGFVIGLVVVLGLLIGVVVLHGFLLLCALVNGTISFLTPFARRVRRFIRREASQA